MFSKRKFTEKTLSELNGISNDLATILRTSLNLANALKYLVFFRNLSRLHLRFSSYFQSDYNYNADSPFRYRVIDIVFHCIEITWTETNQNNIYDTLQKEDSEFADVHDDLALSSRMA
ncbi:Uncharacterized protein HZ326_6812 [Fusarium oxysporum f. sp. albedinis]|nr:Uncharacterized protein HZ326_6812 [Fusarium oxysporum f. sp. albedinis]